MKRSALAAGAGILLAVAWAAPAFGQGAVLGPDSAPLRIARARALVVFQEFGSLEKPELQGRDNREDLLVELELAEPAPGGAAWLLAAPGEASISAGSPAALDELGAHWRSAAAAAPRGGQAPLPPWPAEEGAGAASGIRAGPGLSLEVLRGALAARKLKPDDATEALLAAHAAEGWSFFLVEVPAGARRLVAHLTFRSVVAVYPGALGAVPGPATGEAWLLPPTELMVLHSHFLNVDDNPAGLQQRLGLALCFQESGTLRDGGRSWQALAESAGRTPEGADANDGLRSLAAFLGGIAPKGRLFLTVLSGSPRSTARPALDFALFSHYPSAVEPLPAARSLILLAGVSVALMILATWLLKRKESMS